MRSAVAAVALTATVALAQTACARDRPDADDETASSTHAPATGHVIAVPGDGADLQAAVDRAAPGDTVELAPGVHHGPVDIRTDGIELRGAGPDDTLLDGGDAAAVGITISAHDVNVRDLAVTGFTGSGVEVHDTTGFRLANLTTWSNGAHGLRLEGARDGEVSGLWSSGHPGAGMTIRACFPCEVTVTDALLERNGVGLEVVDAGGELAIEDNRATANRQGIVLASERSAGAPQRNAIVNDNVIDGAGAETAAGSIEPWGVGIAVAGGRSNRIEGNVVGGHATVGISLGSAGEFLPESNLVVDNELAGNALDLAYRGPVGSTLANCFRRNHFETSRPPAIERTHGCFPEATGGRGDPDPASPTPGVDPATIPRPQRD